MHMTSKELDALLARNPALSVVGAKPKAKSKPMDLNLHPYRSDLEHDVARHLDLLQSAGEIVAWRYEPMRLRLADGAWYTPDFLLVRTDAMELWEAKGFMREAANVRLKVAAELYPWFRFKLVRRGRGASFDISSVRKECAA